MKGYAIALTFSALMWALVVGAVAHAIYTSQRHQEAVLLQYVSTMSDAGLDEMCEVWSQGQEGKDAVIRSLTTLSGAHDATAARVASIVCRYNS